MTAASTPTVTTAARIMQTSCSTTRRLYARGLTCRHPPRREGDGAGVVRRRRYDRDRIERTGSSAAADLTWRARAPEEATRRGLLPRLFSVVLRGSGGNRRHHRRRRSLFYRRC